MTGRCLPVCFCWSMCCQSNPAFSVSYGFAGLVCFRGECMSTCSLQASTFCSRFVFPPSPCLQICTAFKCFMCQALFSRFFIGFLVRDHIRFWTRAVHCAHCCHAFIPLQFLFFLFFNVLLRCDSQLTVEWIIEFRSCTFSFFTS